MLSGESLISTDVSTEIFFGRPAINTAVELRSKPVYVWYDYFCCPQLEEQEKARAIGAIPAARKRKAVRNEGVRK